MEKIIDYHLTTYVCKHHRPKLEMVFNSPKGVEEVAKYLTCPKCGQFGLEMKAQKKDKSYSVHVTY